MVKRKRLKRIRGKIPEEIWKVYYDMKNQTLVAIKGKKKKKLTSRYSIESE